MTATLPLRIEVNGRSYEHDVEPRRTLADLLRVAETPYLVDASSAVEDEGALEGLLASIEPEDDIEVSSVYRRRVAPVLARRALREAAERARQKEKT